MELHEKKGGGHRPSLSPTDSSEQIAASQCSQVRQGKKVSWKRFAALKKKKVIKGKPLRPCNFGVRKRWRPRQGRLLKLPVFWQAGSRLQTSFFIYGLCSCSASVLFNRVAFQTHAPLCIICFRSKGKMHENVLRRPGYRTHASYNHNHKCLGWDLAGNPGLCLFAEICLLPGGRAGQHVLHVNVPGAALGMGVQDPFPGETLNESRWRSSVSISPREHGDQSIHSFSSFDVCFLIYFF